jgi:Kef-type K+ transport system membrane component KefB
LVAGLAASGGIQWVQVGILIVEALGFVAVMIFVAPRVIGRMRPGLQRMSSHNAPLILALAICLGLSVAAEKVGMAAIIGAFFAGFAFSEYAPEWKLRPGVNGITEFFAPFFFFIMGAKLNLGVINKDVALIAIVISLLAIVSKLVGCGLPVLREGWRIALKVGVGMTPRGEVGLIVALAGLSINMISESSYAVIMLMTASTTLFAPPILRVLFSEDRNVPQQAAAAVPPTPQGF